MSSKTIILADGNFPKHKIPLEYLSKAGRIICCDGSAEVLVKNGLIPEAIVGDLDSLTREISEQFSDRLFRDDDQNTNDLTKAVKWCIKKGYTDIVILGATGKREDHTVGNISLLAEYSKEIKVIMVTDTGTLTPVLKSTEIKCFPGQQVSIFSLSPETEITSSGLRYPLNKKRLNNWWEATLNEALGNNFTLEFNNGRLIVYLKYS